MESKLKRLLTPPFIVLAALILWFWEWLWEPLARVMAQIGRWPVFRLAEAWLANTSCYVALACFAIPGILLFPFKILGLYFLTHGAPILGLTTFFAAKVVGTALVAHVFTQTRTQLMEIAWFARAYGAVLRFRHYVFASLHRHPAYRRTKAVLAALRPSLQGISRGLFFHTWRRWKAVYRHVRRRGRAACP